MQHKVLHYVIKEQYILYCVCMSKKMENICLCAVISLCHV